MILRDSWGELRATKGCQVILRDIGGYEGLRIGTK